MKKIGGLIMWVAGTALITGFSLVLLRHIGPTQRVTGLLPPGRWQLFKMQDDEAAA